MKISRPVSLAIWKDTMCNYHHYVQDTRHNYSMCIGLVWHHKEGACVRAKSLQSGWYHRLNGLEFEQAPGDGEGQGSLACCSPEGCKDSDTTE